MAIITCVNIVCYLIFTPAVLLCSITQCIADIKTTLLCPTNILAKTQENNSLKHHAEFSQRVFRHTTLVAAESSTT